MNMFFYFTMKKMFMVNTVEDNHTQTLYVIYCDHIS